MSRELWDLQRSFNERFWATRGGWPSTLEDRTAATKDFTVHLIKEVTEVLDEVSFKMHRAPRAEVDRSNILEEIIDTQKFLWGLAQLWGFSWEEVELEFRRKSSVVEQRFTQEQQLETLRRLPCAVVDIDGVLAAYPAGFYAWLGGYLQRSPYQAQQHYEGSNLRDREALKRLYRQSGAKAKLPLLPGAAELLRLLRLNDQLKIVLLTNRPYAEHYRIYPDTLEWLSANNLPYDAIFWARDKGLEALRNLSNISWAVDDSPENVRRLREAGITVAHLNPADPASDTLAFYNFVLEEHRSGRPLAHAAHAWSLRSQGTSTHA